MKAWLTAGLLAVAALAATPSTSQAQFSGPFSGPFGCGTFCVCHFGKMHAHGPLYNYGPYYGYPPYTNNCGNGNCGWNKPNWFHRDRGCDSCGHSWNKYACSTWKNIFHRTHPCGNKVGCGGCK